MGKNSGGAIFYWNGVNEPVIVQREEPSFQGEKLVGRVELASVKERTDIGGEKRGIVGIMGRRGGGIEEKGGW